MTQHTPGPWTLDTSPDERTFVRSVEGWVADLRGGRDEAANARLIAKAPEMHVKLARALVALSKYDYGLADSISLDVFETWQEIDRIAEEAI